MSAPMTDLHLKHIIELGIKTILANPDKHLADIFGDAKIDPHAALYGARTIAQVKNWIQTTKIPVILGFDLVDAQLPAVTVHLAGSTPKDTYVGDFGLAETGDLLPQEREVLVPSFQPATAEFLDNKTSLLITLKEDMPFEQQQLLLPGLRIRDAQGREYAITIDIDSNILIIDQRSDTPVANIDLTGLEVVSPVIQARYSRGNLLYNEQATVVVHGHSSRNEGLWLYYIVMWSLLKFRPVMESTFGLMISTPSASDYSKEDQFLGENVWRRYINISADTLWSWEQARDRDVLAMLLSIVNDRVSK